MGEYQQDKVHSIKSHHFNIENTSFEAFAGNIMKYDNAKPYSHFFYVIIFVLQGSMRVAFEKDEIVMSPGEVLILSPSVNHMPIVEDDNTNAGCISFAFSQNSIEEGNDLYGKLAKLPINERRYIKKSDAFFEAVIRCFNSILACGKYDISSTFYMLVVSLLKQLGVIAEEEIDSMDSDSDMVRVNKINTMANVHYDKKISMKEIAAMLSLSTRQTERIINKNFNCSWKELIIRKRMQVAAELLQNTDMSVEEIARCVGYEATRGFYTRFRNFYKCSPGDFRAKK